MKLRWTIPRVFSTLGAEANNLVAAGRIVSAEDICGDLGPAYRAQSHPFRMDMPVVLHGPMPEIFGQLEGEIRAEAQHILVLPHAHVQPLCESVRLLHGRQHGRAYMPT